MYINISRCARARPIIAEYYILQTACGCTSGTIYISCKVMLLLPGFYFARLNYIRISNVDVVYIYSGYIQANISSAFDDHVIRNMRVFVIPKILVKNYKSLTHRSSTDISRGNYI